MDYIFMLISFTLALPVSYYIIRYGSWVYPEYHKDDLLKMQLSIIGLVCSVVLTIFFMAIA